MTDAGITLVSSADGVDAEKADAINSDKLAQIDDKFIVEACEEMEAIDEQRQTLNDEASTIRSRLREAGILTAAFNAAYARYKMDSDKRQKMDAAFAKCANALDVGYTPDLFRADK